MKRIFIIRKVLVILVVMSLMISIWGVQVGATSGYANKTMMSSYSTSRYNYSYWGETGILYVTWGYDGTSGTVWYGANPYNADSIKHKDISTCTGIGSITISSGGGSASIVGKTVTFTYNVSNNWRLNVNYNYEFTGLLIALNCKLRTNSTVQFGSTFYVWGTS